MKEKKKSAITTLLGYAGSYKALTFIGLTLSAISMLCSIIPYICIWLVVRDLIAVMPDFSKVQNVETYFKVLTRECAVQTLNTGDKSGLFPDLSGRGSYGFF